MNLFSTEQVSKYHPDKYADQISDAILDACLEQDPKARVACETLVKGTTIVLAGEITTTAKVQYEEVVRKVSNKLKYQVDKIINLLGTQSPEIAQGVDNGGAGDQGMMVGYATKETASYLPYAFHIANRIIKAIEHDVDTNPDTILKGDAKTQVTIDLDTNEIHTILISACHKEGITIPKLRIYIENLLHAVTIPTPTNRLLINPAGLWTIGGAIADCGLTGRKIVCDQYGGFIQVGGGAFSGKDPSKVDRSAAYMARYLAVQLLNRFPHLKDITIQLAYAIGMPQPVSINVKTTNQPYAHMFTIPSVDLVQFIRDSYDLSPKGITKSLNLLKWNYEEISQGCHYFNHYPINRPE